MFDMDALAAKVRERRGPACIATNGVCYATPEVAEWHNRRLAMKTAGATIAEMKAALDSDLNALRKAGHNI